MLLDLVPLWAGVLALSVLMYVLLDGFDLGVGMLFFFHRDEAERDRMIASVSPVWDFNETWLVLGGTLLLAAFPGAFSVVVPAVYFPVLAMLLGLLFRGVAFEFRGVAGARKTVWSRAFAIGSLVATAAQGVVLGMFVQGFVCVIAFIAVVSVWTPLADARIAARWFAWPNLLFFSPVPVLTAALAWLAARSLRRGGEALPFVASIGLFFLAFSGLTISLWPHVAPPSITLWSAASASASQEFLMIGTAFMLPVLLFYVCWSYWVFRGKVRGDVGYEHM
ncbi:cytochrome d ubiquinol oxidase subunit II [Burkholderia pseudomallei]|uniref:cytochrome d ubiquinol oxidase subunit II n=1 Tax=Burkholderia pseudomallei TaxID=28450 RepID=UPI000067432A|nr:cytochrome d ubiquinol oxidase subunit II [Burkholderia pseudomallei]AIP67376.1 cytochrome oxidase subunit II family protein [Burkholderia pseudomallei]AJW88441.1 cytochrome oxidase subunit II family protein [Burkholderia pseudomallei 406e]EDO87931.1 cytochrome D ubiquinol oxidase subunit II [Burkholderia pseudomallei 406e]